MDFEEREASFKSYYIDGRGCLLSYLRKLIDLQKLNPYDFIAFLLITNYTKKYNVCQSLATCQPISHTSATLWLYVQNMSSLFDYHTKYMSVTCKPAINQLPAAFQPQNTQRTSQSYFCPISPLHQVNNS